MDTGPSRRDPFRPRVPLAVAGPPGDRALCAVRRRDFLRMAALGLPAAALLPSAGRAAQGERPARRVDVHDARRADAEEMARIGGYWVGPTLAPGYRALSSFHERFRQRCLEAKRRNPEVRILARVRFELFARYRDGGADGGSGTPGYQGGFRDEWIQRIDREAWQKDMAPWFAAGFRLEPGPRLDQAWFDRVWDAEKASRPVTYVQIDHPDEKRPEQRGEGTLRVNQVVVDVADAAYQGWLVDELRWGVAHTGADGLIVGAKSGFWMHDPALGGQQMRVLPGGVWSYAANAWDRPGPFETAACVTRSPFGPGEFGGGMSAIFVKLASHGIRCVTVSRPGVRQGDWAPYSAKAREVLLGEAATPPVQRLRDQLRKRARRKAGL